MKILLFNLGTIEHRVLSWEVDGFKSLFDQDIILWGPVPDPCFVYNGKEIPILRYLRRPLLMIYSDNYRPDGIQTLYPVTPLR